MVRKGNPADTVCHLWAHGAQDSARTASDNLYFNGSTLYSYGSHFVIAHILRGPEYGELSGRVIWNDATYSNTTSRHQTYAWRALTREQCDKRLHVPNLNQDSARELDRALRNKTVPEFIRKLCRDIQGHMASIVGKRYGSRPFADALFLARKYERTARAFYAACGKKYPLSAVPERNEDIPADSKARAQFVAQFSRPVIVDDYKTAIANAVSYLTAAADYADEFERGAIADADYRLHVSRNVISSAGEGKRAIEYANRAYAILHGRKSAQAGRIFLKLQDIETRFSVIYSNANRERNLSRLLHFAGKFYLQTRKVKSAMNRGPGFARFTLRNLPGLVNQTAALARELNIDPDSVIGRAIRRAERLDTAACIDKLASDARKDFETGNSYLAAGTSFTRRDALRCYQSAANYIRKIASFEKYSTFSAYMVAKLSDIRAQCEAHIEALYREIQNAEIANISAWIRGESNVRPSYDAGTFARIVGSNVETSRGAIVPVAHACRLARVFDRIVTAGGKEWADGSGPLIGHYRVNRIGADGTLIIGCHEFRPEEARRLRDIVSQCQECQSEKGE